ncbi:hypothetical protein BJY01DRAFT_223933 [Aspergillus pseudoustus]|uniref:NodB homology domain-containing protein n=1 Tax=Aspergillus pseudoustus TaxID=1810923 RepID=A0ABR4J468_9EURO
MHAISALFCAAALASSALASPLVRRVPTGQVITQCTTPNTIALTFDDGPSEYTGQLLDLLSRYGARATFFVLGDAAAANPSLLQRMRREGHQVGSHTYDHVSLPSLDRAGIVSQMTRLDDVVRPALGVTPTYMRPPYLETNDLVLQTLGELDFRVISASVDTKDYENQDANSIINTSFQLFLDEVNSGGNIVLAHDIHYWTVASLAERMLQEVNSRGLTATTVGDCLGEAESAWYH